MYSLRAASPVAIKGEEAIEGLLGGVHFREGGFDAGTSAGSTRRRVDVGDLLDSGEDAIEGMEADLGIGPVEHWAPN